MVDGLILFLIGVNIVEKIVIFGKRLTLSYDEKFIADRIAVFKLVSSSSKQ